MKNSALALTTCITLAAATIEPLAKIDPSSTVHMDSQSLEDYNGYQMRLSWQRGFLVAGSGADFPSIHDQVTLFDSAGKLVRKFNVLLPESKWAYFRSAAVLDSKGSIAIAVDAHAADFPDPAALIGFFDAKGKRTNTLRTDPFATRALCADANGEIWAFGPSPVRGEIDPAWPMLRHVAQNGDELAAYMPRGDFIDRKRGARSADQLFCGKDRLAIYLQTEATYIEIGYDGKLLDRFQLPEMSMAGTTYRFPLPGVQLSEGGIVIGWHGGPFYLKRSTKVWTPVPWEHDTQYLGIVGKQADGSMIIIAAGTNDTQFDWLHIPLDLADAYPVPTPPVAAAN